MDLMKNKLLKLLLARQAMEHLGLSPGEACSIAAGRRMVKIRVEEIDAGNGSGDGLTIDVGEELGAVMGLPTGIRLNIIRSGKMLRLGPLVGVLAGRYSKERNSFGSQDGFFRSLLGSLDRLHGTGFIFCPPDVSSERKSIYAYYLSGKGDERWKRMDFPFPDVCYNRYFSQGGSPGSYNSIALLARHGVKTFNKSIGSKWAVHRLLMPNSDVAAHLPETRLMDSVKVLAGMLKRHQEVYLKPPSGCKGKGIVRVSRKKKAYLVLTADGSSYFCRTAQEVLQKTRASIDSSMPIIQQSIRFAGHEQHTDFRVLVQKNRYNKWGVTGIAGRLGANGRIITNLHAGGKAREHESALLAMGFDPSQVVSIKGDLEDLALRIAQIIDSKAQTLGELGLDFLVDTGGKVWFLEANPKPGRRSFREISQDLRQAAVSRPMEYACYLAGF
jgi:hypothetical protein